MVGWIYSVGFVCVLAVGLMIKKIEKLIEKLRRVQLRGNTAPRDLDALDEAIMNIKTRKIVDIVNDCDFSLLDADVLNVHLDDHVRCIYLSRNKMIVCGVARRFSIDIDALQSDQTVEINFILK